MKKLKSKKSNLKNRTINFFKDIYHHPMHIFACITDIIRHIGLYISTNIFFCLFVLFNVINGVMLRYFSVGGTSNLLAYQPLLADLAIVIALGSLGYFMRHKFRVLYWFILTLIGTIICVVNSVYYTFYSSFVSVSLLLVARYADDVGDAIFDILRFKDFSYILLPICLLFIYLKLSKKKYFDANEPKYKEPKKAVSTLLCGGILGLIFVSTLNSTDLGRIAKQWNREYIVVKYGVYVYQINDIVKSIEPKISALFGYDEALRKFNEYFIDKSDEAEKNKYTDVLEGKNVVVIHAESLQDFVIGLELNGELVAPNFTKLAKSGIYFSNFYPQVSMGTSSDSEFTFNTGLMPSESGTVFVSYFDRHYVATPALLKEKGYYAVSMHGNVASFWNRMTMHKNLGYDEVIGKSGYDIDETIGLGLTDKSFFRQSVQKLKDINSKHDKFYATLITLTNHTPFDVDTGFDVTMKVEEKDETGKKVVNTYPYMEGTKLGRYLKSVHYADEAFGEFMTQMEEEGLLDNTVVVLYGDHDARLDKKYYERFYNYDYKTDGILPKNDPNYVEFDSYAEELNRSTPFVIWTKDKKIKGANMNREIETVMGMYDAMPTLGNMLGFYNKYALGHDMFSLKENDNIVVFPTGNWLTNKVYYNAQKGESRTIGESILPEDYITKNCEYAEKLLSVSNSVIVYNLLANVNQEDKDAIDESEIIEGAS